MAKRKGEDGDGPADDAPAKVEVDAVTGVPVPPEPPAPAAPEVPEWAAALAKRLDGIETSLAGVRDAAVKAPLKVWQYLKGVKFPWES